MSVPNLERYGALQLLERLAAGEPDGGSWHPERPCRGLADLHPDDLSVAFEEAARAGGGRGACLRIARDLNDRRRRYVAHEMEGALVALRMEAHREGGLEKTQRARNLMLARARIERTMMKEMKLNERLSELLRIAAGGPEVASRVWTPWKKGGGDTGRHPSDLEGALAEAGKDGWEAIVAAGDRLNLERQKALAGEMEEAARDLSQEADPASQSAAARLKEGAQRLRDLIAQIEAEG